MSQSVIPDPDQVDVDAVLSLQMNSDLGWSSVREYLVALARKCWIQEDGFSGKRPFGNSGWKGDVEIALIKAGYINGKIDDEMLDEVDEIAAHTIILRCFDRISNPETVLFTGNNAPESDPVTTAENVGAAVFSDVPYKPISAGL